MTRDRLVDNRATRAPRSRGGRLAIAAGAVAVPLAPAASGGAAAKRPVTPTVVGPRTTTTGAKHAYVFSSRERGVGASRFRYRCSVDEPKLHSCPHRLTLTFAAATHVLRVQAVDPAGRQSPTAHITIVARTSLTQLHLTQLWQVHLAQAANHNFFDLAVGSSGRIYVADSAADRLDVYDPNGNLTFRFGAHGSAAGEFGFLSPDDVGPGTGRELRPKRHLPRAVRVGDAG